MKEKFSQKQSGITLVALVVTIVVLLILAGITIMYTMGDNSIFQKAQEAKNKTEQAIQNEQEYMNSIDNMLDKYIAGETVEKSISLNRTTETIEPSSTFQLIATVKPSNATNKTFNWSSSDTNIATVSDTGLVTGIKAGEVVITATITNETELKASCNFTVETDWELMNKKANVITKDNSITSSSTSATAVVEGISYTINVGDIYDVKYENTYRRVRVLGFKHDDLVDTTVYGETYTKAGISFEFLDFMTGENYMPMNESDTNAGGWANTKMRKDLNGYLDNSTIQNRTLEGLGANLNNKSYIKQVKKKYIATYNNASSVAICNDYLWMLASSEVVKAGHADGYYAYAVTSEGSQYKFYQEITEDWNAESTNRIKKTSSSGSASWWWLRSPGCNYNNNFGFVYRNGSADYNSLASYVGGVAPGFCI